jgi:hypothetical protein
VILSFNFLGFAVEIVVELSVTNEYDYFVEQAELNFPLLEGSYVCGYAIEIGGTMVDAVIVTKEKAQKTFAEETETFQKSTTSIVEKNSNVFKTKLNCLESKTSRRIRLVIQQTVDFEERSDYYVYNFPIDIGGATSLNINSFVSNCIDTNLMDTYQKTERDKNFKMMVCGTYSIFEYYLMKEEKMNNNQFSNYFIQLPLLNIESISTIVHYLRKELISSDIILPHISLNNRNTNNSIKGNMEGNNYTFFYRDIPIIKSTSSSSANSSSPDNILIFWDISLSRIIRNEKKNRNKDLNLLKKLLEKWNHLYLENSFKSDVTIHVCTFNDIIQTYTKYSLKSQQHRNELVKSLETVKYNSASDLSIYSKFLSSKDGNTNFSFCLLFTDGIDNFGHSNDINLFKKTSLPMIPLFFCCSSQNRNKVKFFLISLLLL